MATPDHLLSILNQVNSNIYFIVEKSQTGLPFSDKLMNKSGTKIWMDIYNIPINSNYMFHLCQTSHWIVSQISQQTFFLMKTSSRRLDQDDYVCLSLTSSEKVLKTSSRRLGQDQYICLDHMSWRRLQDFFKTSSRRLQNLFKTSSRHLQDVFKTSWKA